MAKVKLNYVKSSLIYPNCEEIKDFYTVIVVRTTEKDREDSLNTALKELTK